MSIAEKLQTIAENEQRVKDSGKQETYSFLTNNYTHFVSLYSGKKFLTTVPKLDTSEGTNFGSMFSNCSSLTEVPEMDTSKGTNFNGMFSYCSSLTEVPEMDTSKGTQFGDMFRNCTALKTIPILDFGKNTYAITYTFSGCTALENIDFVEYSLTYPANFSQSKLLSHESLLNIIKGLADLTGKTSKKLTLGSDNLSKLTEEEKAVINEKNWTYA